MRSCSESTSNAGSAIRFIRNITTRDGTSPERPECLAPQRRPARLLGLSEQQMLWALGLAATQPVGLQEMFGSMTKSFHPGRAAQNGLTAALLASKDFTSSEQSLEAKYGWANVVSTAHNYGDITKRSRRAIRDFEKHLQAVRLRRRDASDDRRLHSAAQ